MKTYDSPEMEIIMLYAEDIVRTSNSGGDLGGGEDELPVIPLFR